MRVSKRHGLGEMGQIAPGERNAGGRRHGDQMHGVIGRAAGREQADDAIDDGALIDDAADRRVVIAERGDRQRARGGGAVNSSRSCRIGIDEGRARQMQAHDLHQHLVGIGGAVEGAGAGAVIGARLGLEQGVAADFAFGMQLADFRLLVIGKARTSSARRE